LHFGTLQLSGVDKDKTAKCTNYLNFVADEEFDELCFDFGIELDEVVLY
jgi:hypothetical protein